VIKQRQLDVFRNCQFFDQVKVLKDETDVLFTNNAALRLVVGSDVFVEKELVAIGRVVQHADNVEQC